MKRFYYYLLVVVFFVCSSHTAIAQVNKVIEPLLYSGTTILYGWEPHWSRRGEFYPRYILFFGKSTNSSSTTQSVQIVLQRESIGNLLLEYDKANTDRKKDSLVTQIQQKLSNWSIDSNNSYAQVDGTVIQINSQWELPEGYLYFDPGDSNDLKMTGYRIGKLTYPVDTSYDNTDGYGMVTKQEFIDSGLIDLFPSGPIKNNILSYKDSSDCVGDNALHCFLLDKKESKTHMDNEIFVYLRSESQKSKIIVSGDKDVSGYKLDDHGVILLDPSDIQNGSFILDKYDVQSQESQIRESICSLQDTILGKCNDKKTAVNIEQSEKIDQKDLLDARNDYYNQVVKKNSESDQLNSDLLRFVSEDVADPKAGSIIDDDESSYGNSGVEGGLSVIGADIDIGNEKKYEARILELQRIQDQERTLTPAEREELDDLRWKTAFGAVEGWINFGIDVIFGFLGLISVGAILYGGFVWVTSGGEEDQVTSGKSILLWSSIALVIVIASHAIITTVVQVFGLGIGF